MQWVKALKGYLGPEEAAYSEDAAEREVQHHLRQLLEQRSQPAQESTSAPTGAPAHMRASKGFAGKSGAPPVSMVHRGST